MPKVIFTSKAIADILEIYNYIFERDGEEQAGAIVKRLEKTAYSLDKLPLRGKLPEELVPFGNRKIREVQVAPWRIFYRTDGENVFVLNVLDGRRAIKEMFESILLQ